MTVIPSGICFGYACELISLICMRCIAVVSSVRVVSQRTVCYVYACYLSLLTTCYMLLSHRKSLEGAVMCLVVSRDKRIDDCLSFNCDALCNPFSNMIG